MREMKDSGVDWIGEIPHDWEIVQTKRVFRSIKRVVGNQVGEYERLALTLNGVIKRSKEDNEGLQPEKFEGYQILKENETKLHELAKYLYENETITGEEFMQILQAKKLVCEENASEDTTV